MNKRRVFDYALRLIIALVLPLCAQAQQSERQSEKITLPGVSRVENFRLDSKLMARQMPYRVLFPVEYSAREKMKERYPVIYLLHGLGGHFDNWTDKTKLAEYAAQYKFLIVTPEGGDGWYTDSPLSDGERYETYITEELIPEIDRKFRTVSGRNSRVIAGLSMGGYGAFKYGLKYPEKFVLVGSFSGALSGPLLNEKNSSAWIAKSVRNVFGSEMNEAASRANDIFRIAREMPAEKTIEQPFFYFDCGTEDIFARSNRDFMHLLVAKKIPHEFRQLPGGHNWMYWDSRAEEFLRLTERFLRREKAKAN